MPLKGYIKTRQEQYRIFDSITPDENGCHNWPRAKLGHYWRINIDGKKGIRVHVVALERKLGRPIKPGFEASHSCDNRSCVNPDHLFEVTHKENMQQRLERNPKSYAHAKDPKNLEMLKQYKEKARVGRENYWRRRGLRV